jgi:hypothetical protein
MISKDHHSMMSRLMAENSIVIYFVVHTKFTSHHFERMSKLSDRGRWKWIAETNLNMGHDFTEPECNRSHVDEQDIFPRLYFFSKNLIEEFSEWLERRNLKILDIVIPERSL